MRATLSRIIIFGFLVLVGIGLAKAVYNENAIGIILACISLLSVITFLYLVAKANRDMQQHENQ